jgi:uncharacterized membrane protein YhhN
VALAATGNGRLRRVTKPALMPLLAVQVGTADPLILSGLAASGVGDIALLSKTDAAFTAGLASFLAAHGFYLAAFRQRRRLAWRDLQAFVVLYGLTWIGLNFVLWPRTGRLRLPVLIYGTALVSMGVAALETGVPTVAAGGAAFVISDSVLALNTFGSRQRKWADAVVMATYTLAQALIAHGTMSPE